MRVVALLGVVALIAGCASDGGRRVNSCAELRALSPVYPYWDVEGIACGGFTTCTEGCPSPCSCPPCECMAGRLSCHAGILCVPYPDASASDIADAASDGPLELHDAQSGDAGPVATSCAAAVEAVTGGTGAIPFCSSTCDTGIACTDYGFCFACPYYVECVGGEVQIQRTGLACDAGR
jgi:hypothetical protein